MVGLTQYDMCPYKKGKFGHRDRHAQGECHMNIKAEIRMLCLHYKEHQRLLENHLEVRLEA